MYPPREWGHEPGYLVYIRLFFLRRWKMSQVETVHREHVSELSPIFLEDAFARLDETDDEIFYARDRFVDHLDATALTTIEELIGTLVVESSPVILDLMAGWNSHIPKEIRGAQVIGLGLNRHELERNEALIRMVIHDLNKDPKLPFPDSSYNVVLNTVSVDYMTKPLEVFKEVGRILKPGGLFLVIFSNRMFPQKAVKVWREATEEERVILIEEFFQSSELFERPQVFASKGQPRPKDDKYAHLGIPSDPVYAVYAERKGLDGMRIKRPEPLCSAQHGRTLDADTINRRKKEVGKSLSCPYCGEKMRKWAVPDNPFSQTWDNNFMFICFNDECPYFVRGWNHMYRDGNRGVSYRLMYNPEKDHCMAIPVPSPGALKDGIVEEEA
jgi:SAM-dependent methyltransferase